MDKERKSEIHITNNFNAPIGQHIDHVDTINFRMDGDGTFHFGMVEDVKKKDGDRSDEASDGQRIGCCLEQLWKEQVLKHLYDYTWVMEVMNETDGMPTFNTPASFIGYLKDLNVEKIPSEDSIGKKLNVFSGSFPNWVFTDCDTREANRRINIGRRFLSLYRKEQM